MNPSKKSTVRNRSEQIMAVIPTRKHKRIEKHLEGVKDRKLKQQNKGVSGAGNEADIRPENAEKKAGANSWSRTGEGDHRLKGVWRAATGCSLRGGDEGERSDLHTHPRAKEHTRCPSG